MIESINNYKANTGIILLSCLIILCLLWLLVDWPGLRQELIEVMELSELPLIFGVSE